MEKILQINYLGRNISIEETAYPIFLQYEKDLKAYFLKEEGGEETFLDLQYRMGEIFDQKLKSGKIAINQLDIEELISTIGRPSDFEGERYEPQNKKSFSSAEKKKLFRNKFKNEKMIGGVCSGIANYFSIDPIAVRLVFIVFTIFNIATLFKFNLGIIAYILLWIILKPAYLTDNISKKLFRNPKDKVLGGVCSGLSQFFNTESWIVRSLFLVPFLIGILSNGNDWHQVHFLGTSFFSLSFICYIILWVIVPLAKNSTDYMLLKGEPINLSTIQHSTTMENITAQSKSGLNTVLKVLAYIFIIIFLISMIPVAGSFIMISVLSFNLTDIILFSALNKTLALCTILFLVALPFVGLILWAIRRLVGYRNPNKPLRFLFIGLHTLGWVSGILLIANLVSDNKAYTPTIESISIPIKQDTLYLQPYEKETEYVGDVFYNFNPFSSLIEKTPSQNRIKGVWIKYKKTDEADFRIEIEKSAFGQNRSAALDHANATFYDYKIDGNKLLLSSILKVKNKQPYHFQNIKVTVFVPKNKTIIVSEAFKKQMKHSFRANHDDFFFSFDDDQPIQTDQVISFDDSEDHVIRVGDEKMEEVEEKKERIRDAAKEMEDKVREAKRELEDAKIEAERKIEEAKKTLEDSIKDTINN